MATEASKTRAIWGEDVLSLLKGEGIDVGCGPDPILPGVDRFDQEQGDANEITRFVKKRYDFVFSSHALEHMRDPVAAYREWFSLLKPGGHAVVVVPDEDLYEQGCFPSAFNSDHKFTFTISKARSWSPRSVNVLDLVKEVNGELISVSLQDQGLDRNLVRHRPSGWALKLGRRALRLAARFPRHERLIVAAFATLGAAVDQTGMREPRLAQIQLIVRKRVV